MVAQFSCRVRECGLCFSYRVLIAVAVSSLLPVSPGCELAPFHLCLPHAHPFSCRLPLLLQRCSPWGSPAGCRCRLRPPLTPGCWQGPQAPPGPPPPLASLPPRQPDGGGQREDVPSRNRLIEVLLFGLGELMIVVVFSNLVAPAGFSDQTKNQEEAVLLTLCVMGKAR